MSIAEIMLRAVAALLVLMILFPALYRFFGAEEAYAVRRLEEYFCKKVYPRHELPEQWQKVRLARHQLPTWAQAKRLARERKQKGYGTAAPRAPIDAEALDAEMKSAYYLRTGQSLADLTREMPVEYWYGIEAWIRDILTSRVDQQELCAVPGRLTEHKKAETNPISRPVPTGQPKSPPAKGG